MNFVSRFVVLALILFVGPLAAAQSQLRTTKNPGAQPPATRYVCRGFANSCEFSGGFSSFQCEQQTGCFWDDFHRACSGFARDCSSFFDSYSCGRQQGCYWQPM